MDSFSHSAPGKFFRPFWIAIHRHFALFASALLCLVVFIVWSTSSGPDGPVPLTSIHSYMERVWPKKSFQCPDTYINAAKKAKPDSALIESLRSSRSSECSIYGDKSGPMACNGYDCYLGHCICPSHKTLQDMKKNPVCKDDPPASVTKATKAKQCRNLEAVLESRDMAAMCNYDYCMSYSPLYGIMHHSMERWKRAQGGELLTWKISTDSADRDDQHSLYFQQYEAIKGKHLGDLLEVGAGPFTQTRTVLRLTGSEVSSITLAEPQLVDYAKHVAGCQYSEGKLNGFENIPLQLVQSGGELLKWRDAYDTVIMMNVIEHVQNGFSVLQNLFNAVKPGGILVFHERWYDCRLSGVESAINAGLIPDEIPYYWDHLHPTSPKRAVYDLLLAEFDVLFEKSYFFEGIYSYAEGGYWIARKKPYKK